MKRLVLVVSLLVMGLAGVMASRSAEAGQASRSVDQVNAPGTPTAAAPSTRPVPSVSSPPAHAPRPSQPAPTNAGASAQPSTPPASRPPRGTQGGPAVFIIEAYVAVDPKRVGDPDVNVPALGDPTGGPYGRPARAGELTFQLEDIETNTVIDTGTTGAGGLVTLNSIIGDYIVITELTTGSSTGALAQTAAQFFAQITIFEASDGLGNPPPVPSTTASALPSEMTMAKPTAASGQGATTQATASTRSSPETAATLPNTGSGGSGQPALVSRALLTALVAVLALAASALALRRSRRAA